MTINEQHEALINASRDTEERAMEFIAGMTQKVSQPYVHSCTYMLNADVIVLGTVALVLTWVVRRNRSV